jgi:enoyl-CoA hydratase/carnithine racemase
MGWTDWTMDSGHWAVEDGQWTVDVAHGPRSGSPFQVSLTYAPNLPTQLWTKHSSSAPRSSPRVSSHLFHSPTSFRYYKSLARPDHSPHRAPLTPPAPLAVAAAKSAITSAPHLPLPAGLDLERTLYDPLLLTEDRQEGLRAFAEKRTARFQGR